MYHSANRSPDPIAGQTVRSTFHSSDRSHRLRRNRVPEPPPGWSDSRKSMWTVFRSTSRMHWMSGKCLSPIAAASARKVSATPIGLSSLLVEDRSCLIRGSKLWAAILDDEGVNGGQRIGNQGIIQFNVVNRQRTAAIQLRRIAGKSMSFSAFINRRR
jgi:hypothetical protein